MSYYLPKGAGQLEQIRKPLAVNRVTYNRAMANLAPMAMGARIDPAPLGR